MKANRNPLVILCVLCVLIGGCTPRPLLPPAFTPASARGEGAAVLVEELRGQWAELRRPDLSPEARGRVVAAYNRALLDLLRAMRHQALQVRAGKLRPEQAPLLQAFPVRYADMPGTHSFSTKELYDDIVPADDVPMEDPAEHYHEPGLGVPVVGVVPWDRLKHFGPQAKVHFSAKGTVSTMTAVLDFPRGSGRPELVFLRRLRQDTYPVGRMRYQLAADFSAPLEVYWGLTRVKDNRWLGMLRPQALRPLEGLSSAEEYNPRKIPVILTHGLMSSAGTWDKLVNRLMTVKEIRETYQFWYFNYPTGISWVVTAAEYRKALANAREVLDPEHKNRNWDRMVVVGHSMGGLITHYSQCENPWDMLRSLPDKLRPAPELLQARYIDTPFDNPRREAFREQFYFRPVQAGLVVYMATPHRGAPLASYRIVAFLTRLVELPTNLLSAAVDLVTLQQDSLLADPSQLTDWFTSVGQLSPSSYSIRGLGPLRVRPARTHSVIGVKRFPPGGQLARSSDGVVPYYSSHLNWGTETTVLSDHSVQDTKTAALDLAYLLLEYARACEKESGKRN